jgi:hypothetical protein
VEFNEDFFLVQFRDCGCRVKWEAVEAGALFNGPLFGGSRDKRPGYKKSQYFECMGGFHVQKLNCDLP